MEILTTKHYSLRQHPHYKLLGLTVGLVDGDSENRSFYQQKLEQANLLVQAYEDLVALEEALSGAELHAVVYSPDLHRLDKEIRVLGKFIANNPQLPVITMSKTMQEMQLDAIMKQGTRLHINRDLSHPRDLLVALEQVL
jgi:DNA-binding NtrC family response regulator